MSQETFIDILLERSRLENSKHPKYRGQHVLIIDSLKNGKAFCSCGRWVWTGGEVCSSHEICKLFASHSLHEKSQPKNGTSNANCGTRDGLDSRDFTAEALELL